MELDKQYYSNLVNKIDFLLKEKKFLELIKVSHKIIKQKKFENLVFYGNLGLAYLSIKKFQLAIKYFKKILNINPYDSRSLHNIGLTYKQAGDTNNAKINFLRSIKNSDTFDFSFYEVIELLLENNQIHEMQNIIDENRSSIPFDLLFFLETGIFDLKFKNEKTFKYNLEKISKKIKKYLSTINENKNYFKLKILNSKINYIPITNFRYTFYCNNALEEQKNYIKILDVITDQFSINKEFTILKKNKKIKIAFASSIWRHHTIMKLFKNWILKINKEKFDVNIIDLQSLQDEHYLQITKNVSKVITTENNIENSIKKIRNENFNYLIYLDNHISRESIFLSTYKLAEKQACTWGHPMTSGSKNIDYFLSSELMENTSSQKQYIEKLIKLKNLSVYYEYPKFKPDSSVKDLFDSSYLSIGMLQSLFKIQPHEDKIYAEIINSNKNVKIYFLESEITHHSEVIKKRIEKFIINKKDFNRINFLPRCNNNTFLNYAFNCDFLIDCASWSGGNTHLESFSVNKPIITIEGNHLKQNHTLGMLKRMNMQSLICENQEQYLKKIKELSESKSLINKYSQEISINKYLLYNDEEAITSLENFLLDNSY